MSTRNFRPGDTYSYDFAIKSSTGALADADSTPVGAFWRNGAADNTVTVAVAHPQTGCYSASCTIPAGYAGGDRFSLLVTATVGGVATGEFVDEGRLLGYATSGTSVPASLVATGADAVLTEGTLNLPQTLALVLDFLLGIRSGVPAAGSGGTVVSKDPTGASTRAQVTVDASGNITAVTLTPPSA